MPILRYACAVLALLAAAPPDTARARDAANIRIVSGRAGTPWHAFAASLAKQLETALRASAVSVVGRGDAVWNPILVNARRAEFGLSNVASASWAYHGDRTAYDGHKYADIRAVMGGMRPVWITAMLRRDYIRRTGFLTLDQALTAGRDGPRIVMEPVPGVVPIVVDKILAAMGSSRRSLRERGGDVVQVGARQIPSMIREGRADVYFEATVSDHPAVRETSTNGDVRFVDLPDGALAALERAGLAARPLPRWFEGQDGPVNAADLGTMVIAHRDVADEVVHAMARTLIDRREILARSHAAFRGYDPRDRWSVERARVPLHPGAARFYRERGWMERRGPR